MNLKMNLTYLSLFIGIVMFSNGPVYAQKGSASIFNPDLTANIINRSAQNQISYKSRFDTRDEKSVFIAKNRKYYSNDVVVNGPSAVLPNYSYNNYAFSKDSTNHLGTNDIYLIKSKHQQTIAYVLLGVGSTMAIVGLRGVVRSSAEMFGSIISWDSEAFNKAGTKGGTYIFIMLSGLAVDLVSIPFFISAHHNKKRATSLSFGNQTIYSLQDKSYLSAVPSLTLRIKL